MSPEYRSTRRRGIALIWVALTGFVMIALMGLAMDLSITVYGKQQLQHGADAAAMAGAALVRTDADEAREFAQQVGLANRVYHTKVELDLNEANAADGDIVLGYYDRKVSTFTPDLVSPNAVRVFARRTNTVNGQIPLVFGPMAGVPGVSVTAEAIAMIGGGTGAGMIVLDPGGECAADFGGTVTINVSDITVDPPDPGAIQINSNYDPAICGQGNVDIEAGEINVKGGADLGGIDYDGEINEDAPVIPDPLADLPAIDPAGMTEVPIPDKGNFSAAPGYHKGTVKRTVTGDVLTLQSGVHVFDGLADDSVAFQVNGGDVLSEPGGGVLLYVHRGSITLEGNGIVKLEPLNAPGGTPESRYNGVTIFQARGNTTESFIAGGNAMDLTGTLYFPTNPVKIRGGGGGYGNQFIAYQVSTFGTGEIAIKYDGRNIAPGKNVFLVK